MFNNLFEGFVLAGGKSSRMGENKAFLKINGETFLERAVKTLSGVCENRVKIVLNQHQTDVVEKLPPETPHIFDIFENRGALGGIYTALRSSRTKYAVILAVDLPLVTPEAFEKLAEIALSSNKFMAVVPRQTDDRLQPLAAVYLARYTLRPLEKLINENPAASVNDFLDLIAPRTVRQERLVSNINEDIFFNVNYPSDYEKV